MRILYLHQYFVTRSEIGGTRSYEFARYLARRGHQVTMVTAASEGVWDSGGWIRRRNIDTIEIVELRAGQEAYQHGTTLGYLARTFAFVKFAVASSLAVLRLPKPDVVFATSTPLTIGIPALAASKFHKVPLIFEVRDLWPEAPIQLGAIRNLLIISALRWFERTIYRNSSRVIALSPGIRDGVISAGVSPSDVSMIPNASDTELFSPEINGADFRARLGVNGQFVCSYFGAMGEANDLTQVVEAAKILQDRGERQVVFVLHGRGKRRFELEAFCRQHNLDNVVFSDPIPDKHAIARLAAASDVCMTIYKDLPVLQTCSPNKLFDTFAAGRPAIVNQQGWLKDLIESNEAGLYTRPGDSAHLAETVVYLRDHPDVAKKYGENARRLAEDKFDRSILAAQLLSIFEDVITKR